MRLYFSLFIFFLLSCSSTSQSADPQIKDHNQFIAMSSAPLYQKYGQVSALKVVYDNQYEKLHFISSTRYEYHYEYCMQELGYPYDLGKFNRDAYSGDTNRRFLIANINYYQALNKYALELGPSDRMNLDHIRKLFWAVKEDVFFGDELVLMLNTLHVKETTIECSDIPLITPEEIYAGQTYQPISKHFGKGRIVVVEDWESQKDTIKPYDIVLLKDIPMEFPLVAGVIVTDFQTPLSHVSILGQNRKIPICAYSRLFEDNALLEMDKEIVEFVVKQDTFYFNKIQSDLEGLIKQHRRIKLKKDISVDSLIPIEYIKERHSGIVGNKAANFGELYQFSKKTEFKTPESAFAIPFSFYEAHIDRCDLRSKIEELCRNENLLRSRIEVERELEVIRSRMKDVDIDPLLLSKVREMVTRLGDYRRMRFRSSTNAEDAYQFSGAGLYVSKTGDLNSSTKTIEKAILKVWMSLWSYEAFMEREAFNIDQSTVSMGILVHRSFPDEEVNGVAITTNIYRENYLGFVVNAQLGDESVVQPKNDVQCDQFICYPDESVTQYGRAEAGVDIITTSSLNGGELVMSQKEIQQLANTLELIKRHYVRKHYIRTTYFNFGLDIEFKLDGENRQLYIKQMRLYNR